MLTHDPICPQVKDKNGCACSVWILQGNSEFDPEKDCDRCSCFCDIIETARADERSKWVDHSGADIGTHTETCEWWGRDRAYMQYCEDTWAATWVQCVCQRS